MILAQLMEHDPSLIEQDLTYIIKDIGSENPSLIFALLHQHKKEISASITDEIRALQNALAAGPKSSRELQEILHVKRGTFLAKYLYPAKTLKLVAETGRTSSDPTQKYILIKP